MAFQSFDLVAGKDGGGSGRGGGGGRTIPCLAATPGNLDKSGSVSAIYFTCCPCATSLPVASSRRSTLATAIVRPILTTCRTTFFFYFFLIFRMLCKAVQFTLHIVSPWHL
jgi:hypothetical protein